MRFRILVVLLLMPLSASAQTVYKCTGFKGDKVYQSFPCAGAVPAEKVWTGTYRSPTNDELWQRYRTDERWRQRQQAEQARRNANHYSEISSPSASQSSQNALICSAARSDYARVQADFQLNRNINLLRRLESNIRRYCEVRP